MLTDIRVGNQTWRTAVFIQKLLDDSSPRPHLTHCLLSLENVFLCLHLLFVCSCLLYMLCCHLFALLNSFTVLFSPSMRSLPVNLSVVNIFIPQWCLHISIWFVSPVTTNICLWIVLLIFDSSSSVPLFMLYWDFMFVCVCVPIILSVELHLT